MVDPVRAERWGHRALFVLLAMLLLFIRILPLSAMPVAIPGPDLTLCMTFVWVLRRPDYVPPAMIVAIYLLEDLLFMRPPGLWTLIVLMGMETVRKREAMTRDLPFLLEWVLVGAAIFAMIFTNRFVLAVFMVPQTPLGLACLQGLTTILAYPVVVLATRELLGLRRAATGEVDALGHRL